MSPLKLGELHVLLQIHVRDEIVNFCVFYGVYSFVYQINTASAAACLPTLCRLCQKAASVSIVCTKRLAIKIMHMFELINWADLQVVCFSQSYQNLFPYEVWCWSRYLLTGNRDFIVSRLFFCHRIISRHQIFTTKGKHGHITKLWWSFVIGGPESLGTMCFVMCLLTFHSNP